MSNSKAALKAAKAALDKSDFEEAEKQARAVTDEDPNNYFGTVFLGRAFEKQGKLDEAATTYEKATSIKPDDELAWKGLCGIYEAQGTKNITKHTNASLKLAEVHQRHDDQEKCQTTVDGLVSFAKQHGSRAQYKEALRVYLPTSSIFDFLEGRIQRPALTYTRLAEITETDEKERINKEVGQRRTRLGARLNQVQLDVKREVFKDSELEDLYRQIIDWTSDDDERRLYEEKLLQHAYDHMIVLLSDDKIIKRKQVQELAHGMVIIKHPFRLAWDIELEWHDVDDVASVDRNVLLEYIQFFSTAGLSRVIQGFLGQKYMPSKASEEADETKSEYQPLDAEEALLLIDDGIADSQKSAFAHRLVADFYLRSQEYESCADVCRTGQKLLRTERERCGMRFENSMDAISSCLATSLVYYQSPKNHPEAKIIFDDLLKRRPTSTPALLGIGLIHEEQEDFDKASDFLERALSRDPDNTRIAAEAAWCSALNGSLQEGCNNLKDSLAQLEADKHSPRDLRSLVSYRVGRCLWDLHADKAARKDRQGPYAYFISAIRANPSYALAYTSLGIYYAEYAKDRKRARQCYQKAFELSAAEVFAAEQLARAFARDGDWDIVEVVAQRVIDSGAVKPAPGARRKAVSWPFAALGIVQMNKQDFPSAVQSYQSALRVSPQDYHAWVGLGESYLSCGRYNAASKTLEHARSMPLKAGSELDTWFADYMYANVQRELGEYEEAVKGYREILQARPEDFGVSIALLQTLNERAADDVDKGFFQNAAQSASDALLLASHSFHASMRRVDSWKAVGDACMSFARIPAFASQAPFQQLRELLEGADGKESGAWRELVDLDGIDFADVSLPTDNSASIDYSLSTLFSYGLLAQKLAILQATHDTHAKAVAWYNLGWTEYQVSRAGNTVDAGATGPNMFSACATAAVKCFKRAIELEAGNADFWNALGVVTTTLNPKIAQHSLVRSLHLNERSAATWTNLGTLYLTLEDYELAHEAFSRAQSSDPDYVNAWVGEGLVALRLGDENEARSHFEHAFDIADSSEVATKKHYLSAIFDQILNDATTDSFDDLIAPIFASQQIQNQTSDRLPFRRLLALLLERAGDFHAAIEHLTLLANDIEALYETSESPQILGQFVRIKADLGRVQLGARDFEGSKENASTALDLSEDADEESMSAEMKTKTRLSAHLTAGMANYFLASMDDALAMFRAALEETGGQTDVVCLLAQVLWAKGGSNEKSIAKEQLFDVIEKHPGYVHATTILGALSAIDDDAETHEAVMSDLPSLRANSDLSVNQTQQIDKLQILSAGLLSSPEDALSETQRSIMVDPSQSLGWSNMSDLKGEPSVAQMTLLTAMEGFQSDGVADGLANIGMAPEAQRAVALCPWMTPGWEVLQSATAGEG